MNEYTVKSKKWKSPIVENVPFFKGRIFIEQQQHLLQHLQFPSDEGHSGGKNRSVKRSMLESWYQ